ncbi:unnamed protein product [Parajaminaea phylloscopi]
MQAVLQPQPPYPPIETNVDETILYALFRYCAERHHIYHRKEAGLEGKELSSDPLFVRGRYGNVFRQLDRGSAFVRTHVIAHGDAALEEVCFRVFLYCVFSNNDTYTRWERELGQVPSLANFNLARYTAILDPVVAKGGRIYASSFQLVPPTSVFGAMSGHAASLRLVKLMLDVELGQRIAKCKYLVDASALVQAIPTLGGFLSLNLLCYLNDSEHVNLDCDVFASCGPGARATLRKIFGSCINSVAMEEAALRWLEENQWDCWERIGEKPPVCPGLPRPGMRVLDFENALCWHHKYMRAQRQAGVPFAPVPPPIGTKADGPELIVIMGGGSDDPNDKLLPVKSEGARGDEGERAGAGEGEGANAGEDPHVAADAMMVDETSRRRDAPVDGKAGVPTVNEGASTHDVEAPVTNGSAFGHSTHVPQNGIDADSTEQLDADATEQVDANPTGQLDADPTRQLDADPLTQQEHRDDAISELVADLPNGKHDVEESSDAAIKEPLHAAMASGNLADPTAQDALHEQLNGQIAAAEPVVAKEVAPAQTLVDSTVHEAAPEQLHSHVGLEELNSGEPLAKELADEPAAPVTNAETAVEPAIPVDVEMPLDEPEPEQTDQPMDATAGGDDLATPVEPSAETSEVADPVADDAASSGSPASLSVATKEDGIDAPLNETNGMPTDDLVTEPSAPSNPAAPAAPAAATAPALNEAAVAAPPLEEPALDPPTPTDEPMLDKETPEGAYEVEKVINHRSGSIYRVRWLGYLPSEDTWEHETTLRAGAQEALQEYKSWLGSVQSSLADIKRKHRFRGRIIVKGCGLASAKAKVKVKANGKAPTRAKTSQPARPAPVSARAKSRSTSQPTPKAKLTVRSTRAAAATSSRSTKAASGRAAKAAPAAPVKTTKATSARSTKSTPAKSTKATPARTATSAAKATSARPKKELVVKREADRRTIAPLPPRKPKIEVQIQTRARPKAQRKGESERRGKPEPERRGKSEPKRRGKSAPSSRSLPKAKSKSHSKSKSSQSSQSSRSRSQPSSSSSSTRAPRRLRSSAKTPAVHRYGIGST